MYCNWRSTPHNFRICAQWKASEKFWCSLDLLHSSEIRGLCLMKCSSITLQNLSYFGIRKPTSHMICFISCYFICQHRPWHSLSKAARNEKWKIYVGFEFSFSKNMANFEVFCWNISSSINFIYLKSSYSKYHACLV